MKVLQKTLLLFAIMLLLFYLLACKKEKQLVHYSTITLWDKPLSVIQSYIEGKWKLQYTYGGFSVQKYIDTDSSYIILSPEHIIMGNFSLGIFLDTTINWVRTDIGSKEYTYLLRYSRSDYPFPENLIIMQMKNDTLIMRDYEDDGYSYYYTKY
jgi:hypothetical protein